MPLRIFESIMRIYKGNLFLSHAVFWRVVYLVIRRMFIKHALCAKHYMTKYMSPVLRFLKIKSRFSYFDYLWFFKSQIKTIEIPCFSMKGLLKLNIWNYFLYIIKSKHSLISNLHRIYPHIHKKCHLFANVIAQSSEARYLSF